MTKEMIAALRGAGISAETILRVIEAETEPLQPAAEPEEKNMTPEPTPAEIVETVTKKAEPEAQPEANTPAAPDKTDAILDAVERLIGSIQVSNIRGIGRDDDFTQDQKVDQIMTEILSGKKGGK